MRVQSLACQTDLLLAAFDGEIIDRGHYLVIVTPNTPTYFWGNYLLFADPPGPDDFVLWQALFAEEIGYRPGIVHRAFGWEATLIGGRSDITTIFRRPGWRDCAR